MPSGLMTAKKLVPALLLGPVFASGITTSAVASPAETVDGPKISGSAVQNTTLSQHAAGDDDTKSSALEKRINKAVDIALRQVGDPYAYGAAGPGSFDCSGLLFYSYHHAGFRGLPRTSSAQAGWSKPISKRKMQRGDLMFFSSSGGVYHAAIFLKWSHGHAVMVDAPYPGKRVQRAVPWTSSWFGRTLRRDAKH
jgi:cell wall-associated NlpC family hydrolase